MENRASKLHVETRLFSSSDRSDWQSEAASLRPFKVALLGDWTGRANRGVFQNGRDLSKARLRAISRDDLESVMADLDVRLDLKGITEGGDPLSISFKQLEDFHPDCIFKQLDFFEELRDLRSQLLDPKGLEAAADKVRALTGSQNSSPAGEQEKSTAPLSGSVLDQILDGTATATTSKPERRSTSPEIDDLVKEIVKPYVIPASEAEANELTAVLDSYISHKMNALLHHPDFQDLEAAWQGLHLLVSRLDVGTELQLYLFDVSKAELALDQTAAQQPDSSQMYRVLKDGDANVAADSRWALISINYTFETTMEDAKLLEQLAKLGMLVQAPVIGAASPRFVGCESFAITCDPDDWSIRMEPNLEAVLGELKRLEGASYIALAMPRFLLRLPYGKETVPVEAFDYEEISTNTTPPHESYLWANPCFAVTCLLGEAFNKSGWEMVPGDVQELDDLPLHVYREAGEARIKPCAEILMTVRGAEKIIEQGIIPLISIKDRETIRVGLFQSLARRSLAGPWRSIR